MASELEEAEYEDSSFGEADEGYQYGFSKKKAKAKKSQGFSRKKHTKIRVLAGTIAGLVGVTSSFRQVVSSLKDYESKVSSLSGITSSLDEAKALFSDLNALSRKLPQPFDD